MSINTIFNQAVRKSFFISTIVFILMNTDFFKKIYNYLSMQFS